MKNDRILQTKDPDNLISDTKEEIQKLLKELSKCLDCTEITDHLVIGVYPTDEDTVDFEIVSNMRPDLLVNICQRISRKMIKNANLIKVKGTWHLSNGIKN